MHTDSQPTESLQTSHLFSLYLAAPWRPALTSLVLWAEVCIMDHPVLGKKSAEFRNPPVEYAEPTESKPW